MVFINQLLKHLEFDRESFFVELKARSSMHKCLSAFYLTEASNG